MQIDPVGLDGFVAKPQRDDGATHTFVEKLHHRGAAPMSCTT